MSLTAIGQACGLEITLPLQAAENLGNGTGAEFHSMTVQLFRYSKNEYGFNCGTVQDVERNQSPIEIFNHSSTRPTSFKLHRSKNRAANRIICLHKSNC